MEPKTEFDFFLEEIEYEYKKSDYEEVTYYRLMQMTANAKKRFLEYKSSMEETKIGT